MRASVALLPLVLSAAPLLSQETLVRGDDGRRLDSVMRRVEAQGFHGNVLVARRGEPLLLAGYGIANHATGGRYTPATLVQIGSNVKDFTATAIHQLAERGRLRITDSLHRYFDSLPSDKRAITIRHLLEHRAGLPLGVALDQQPLSRDDMLRRFRGLALSAEPGAREGYSNLGYSLLAAIVERVAGRPFEAYLAEQVFAPAGMMETGLALPDFDTARVARGYAGGVDRGTVLDLPRDNDGQHLWSLRGNGGMLSTLGDMHRFYRTLRGSALLRDPAHRRAVLPLDEPGVWAGSDRVSYFAYASFPGRELEILLASNHQEYSGSRVLRELESALGLSGGPAATAVTGPVLDRIPDGPRGRPIAAYLEAYNSGDTTAMRRFFGRHMASGPDSPTIETRLERYRQMRAELGRISVRSVRENAGGGEMVLLATGESGESLTLAVDLEPAPPHRIRAIRVQVGS
jgi:CubicO group peptidase (beta-lactamase class C family)